MVGRCVSLAHVHRTRLEQEWSTCCVRHIAMRVSTAAPMHVRNGTREHSVPLALPKLSGNVKALSTL